MTQLDIVTSDAWEQVEKVAELHVQGISPYTIARRLHIKVIEAKAAIETWQEVINNDIDSRDAARDYLNKLVAHFDKLIEKSYENLNNLEHMDFDEKVSAQINATLKNIADYESKRVDLLQKAGLLDGADLGDEIANLEEQRDMIMHILRNELCSVCRDHVKDKVKAVVQKQNPGIVVGEVEDE
jgi:uncharacterized protein YpbB